MPFFILKTAAIPLSTRNKTCTRFDSEIENGMDDTDRPDRSALLLWHTLLMSLYYTIIMGQGVLAIPPLTFHIL